LQLHNYFKILGNKKSQKCRVKVLIKLYIRATLYAFKQHFSISRPCYISVLCVIKWICIILKYMFFCIWIVSIIDNKMTRQIILKWLCSKERFLKDSWPKGRMSGKLIFPTHVFLASLVCIFNTELPRGVLMTRSWIHLPYTCFDCMLNI
jgi:hypothetical protein